MIKDKLIVLLGILMVSQLSMIGLGVVECVNYAKKYPDKTRTACLEIDDSLQKAVNGYVALILALMVPTKNDTP